MTTKKLILLMVFHMTACATVPASIISLTFDGGFENSGNILDGNVNPWSDTRTVERAAGETIAEVSVRLNISGGYNGDLYGYLSYNGVLVTLLNRVGIMSGDAFGFGDAGLNVTFTDTAANNIHLYRSVPSYTITGGAAWQPDGRTINPVTSWPSDFDGLGTTRLGAFKGISANGDWTLVLADVSSGGGQPRVLSWGLDITTVAIPEPSTAVMPALLGLLMVTRLIWGRAKNQIV